MKAFLIGMSTGAILALLYAPKKGRDTRRDIRRSVDRGRKVMERNVARVNRLQNEVRHQGKRTLRQADKTLNAVLHAGRSVAAALV
jgi:gas vesicle protein